MDERIPTLDAWREALLEEWRSIVSERGTTALQQFYEVPEETVRPHLVDLADRLHRICQKDEALSRRTSNEYFQEIVSWISVEKKIGLIPLQRILARLGEADVPDDQIVARLEAKADEYLKLLDRAALLADSGALALLQAGDVDGAHKKLRAVDIIRLKRDGGTLSRDAIDDFVAGVTSWTWPEYQIAALLMAMALRGMTLEETAWLTDAVARSGDRVELSSVPGPRVTLHDTGAVGDKLALVVPPIVTACGVVVPMIAGRGFGFVGGTLDKLEAIPGLAVQLSTEEYLDTLRTVGCAIVGPTQDIAPADRKLYALRDVSGSIESVPLIAASIVSKVIAAGNDTSVFHVMHGAGTALARQVAADSLANTVTAIAKILGLRAHCVVTPLTQPLGRAVGHALEVAEAIQTLAGRGPDDLHGTALSLAAHMLEVSGRAASTAEGYALADDALRSGAALAVFRRMVAAQRGDVEVIDDPTGLPQSPHRVAVTATESGFVTAIDAQRIGFAAMRLGAGREQLADVVDPGVGILLERKVGDRVDKGEPLAHLYYRSERFLGEATEFAAAAFTTGRARPWGQTPGSDPGV